MQPQYFLKIPTIFSWIFKNSIPLQTMTIPIIFQAKAITTKLIISTAFLLLSIAIFSISFDHNTTFDFKNYNINQEFKNQTSLFGKINHKPMIIPIPGGAAGPESFAFDRLGGGPFTGVSDGRILRWRANESRWVDFAVTSPERDGCVGASDHSKMEHICGRPLGLRVDEKTGGLFIADAYMGLLYVGPNGGLSSPIVKEVNGVALGFTNSLDVDPNTGVVYFTDSSTRFPRRNHVPAIITGDNSGRLMKFDPKAKNATVLLDNLKFPNGVALSTSGDFLLFVETTTCKLYKFWLKTAKVGKFEVVTEFPGFPDNIKRNLDGEFWVGINSQRGKLVEWLISNPWIGKLMVKFLPLDITKVRTYLARLVGRNGMGIRLDRDGNVVEMLEFSKWKEVSEVHEEHGYLWIGSVVMPYLVRDKIPISSYLI